MCVFSVEVFRCSYLCGHNENGKNDKAPEGRSFFNCSPRVLFLSAEKYVREVVSEGGEDDQVVDSDGEVLGFENLVFAIFEFVHALVETNKFKSAVKAGLSELMYYIVIYMQVRIP